MIKVLFVCLGNICRSPMAEAIFADRVRMGGGGERFEIDSAGTGDYHIGDRAHPGTRGVLARHDIPYHGRARQMTLEDLHHYEYIIAMDERNLRDIEEQFGPTQNVTLLLDYVPTLPDREVPDPYFTGDFEGVFSLIHQGVDGLLAHIIAKHELAETPSAE